MKALLFISLIFIPTIAYSANGYRVHHTLSYTFSPEQACYDFADLNSSYTYISNTTISCRVDHSDPNVSAFNTAITSITNYTCPAGYETNSNNDCIIVGTDENENQDNSLGLPPLTSSDVLALARATLAFWVTCFVFNYLRKVT